MVCHATAGYTSNMKIYVAESKKLEETVFSVLEPSLDLWYHVCQNNNYNGVPIAENLLQKKTRVCGTTRANRGLLATLLEAVGTENFAGKTKCFFKFGRKSEWWGWSAQTIRQPSLETRKGIEYGNLPAFLNIINI
jgi:hypothetical protein